MSAASEQSGGEPVSGVQGKGTVTDPFDGGNSADPATAQSGTEPPSGTQGKGTATEPFDGGNTPENDTPSQSNTSKNATTSSERGRDSLAAPARRREERDVSPGTLPDGSHAQTSGDRGEGYEPGKLSKLKSKLAFGKR